jgi:hypothetical protein
VLVTQAQGVCATLRELEIYLKTCVRLDDRTIAQARGLLLE